jgi:hypothetical protein
VKTLRPGHEGVRKIPGFRSYTAAGGSFPLNFTSGRWMSRTTRGKVHMNSAMPIKRLQMNGLAILDKAGLGSFLPQY